MGVPVEALACPGTALPGTPSTRSLTTRGAGRYTEAQRPHVTRSAVAHSVPEIPARSASAARVARARGYLCIYSCDDRQLVPKPTPAPDKR